MAEVDVCTEKVLTALRGRPMCLITMVGLATGMRRGELLALRWGNLDLDGGKLRVEQSLEQTKAGLRFKEPKNEVRTAADFTSRVSRRGIKDASPRASGTAFGAGARKGNR